MAGTLLPASSTICRSGTVPLSLSGSANGSVQYQSSSASGPFTDIAGATSATYTTPVLTSKHHLLPRAYHLQRQHGVSQRDHHRGEQPALTKKTLVPLNFPLPAATGLRLQLLNTGSTASLYRNTTAAVYPYTSPSGQVSITGNTLAPSPASYWQLTLELADPNAKASALTVVNALGQVLLARPLAPGTAGLNLGGLAAGVYQVRVQTPEGVLVQRVVRE